MKEINKFVIPFSEIPFEFSYDNITFQGGDYTTYIYNKPEEINTQKEQLDNWLYDNYPILKNKEFLIDMNS